MFQLNNYYTLLEVVIQYSIWQYQAKSLLSRIFDVKKIVVAAHLDQIIGSNHEQRSNAQHVDPQHINASNLKRIDHKKLKYDIMNYIK